MADSATAAAPPRKTARASDERAEPAGALLPAWAWLSGLVAASVLLRFFVGRRMPAPWIMVDELVYSELAKSFAATGHFLWRDEPISGYGVVYPVLLSPAFRAFGSIPQAYGAAKAINAILMSLAAVPAFLLARRVLPLALSFVAAALAVLVPSMLYTGTLMTENAFYPAFLLAAFALVLCLERPTPLNQAFALAAFLIAFATRAQALALLPAYVTAPLMLAWTSGEGRRSLRRYAVLWGTLGAGGLLFLGVQLARGSPWQSVLGAYETAGHQGYSLEEVARWFLYHVAELDLYVGVLPFAALLLLAVLARELPRTQQALVAAAVSLTFWLALAVAAFASLPTVRRIEERNLFYVAPLLFVALLVWVERGLPRPRAATIACAAVAGGLLGAIPYGRLIGVEVRSDTLELIPWWWLQDHLITLGQVRWVALGLGLLAGAAFVLWPRRLALLLPLLVVAYYAVTTPAIENSRHGVRLASVGALFQGITTGRVDWVDRRVGRDTDVAFVWSGRADAFTLWENEFFNRSIGPVYELANPLGGGLPAAELRLGRRTGLLRDEGGRTVSPRYVLADETAQIAGTRLASDRRKGIVLVRAARPLRTTTLLNGINPTDSWSGAQASYTRLRCAGGRVSVLVLSDGELFDAPQTVVARVGGRRVARAVVRPGRQRRFVVPLERGPGGRCVARFTVSPTAVPADVLPGSTDRRRLGLHFLGFTYRPR